MKVAFAILRKLKLWDDLQICSNALTGSNLLAAGCWTRFLEPDNVTMEE